MSGKSRSSGGMKALKEKFISGCLLNQYPHDVACQLWEQIVSFAGYAFCKAHSASFARVSFVVAYLKVFFPAPFMASVLSNRGGFYSPLVYVEEARRMKVKILPPDVRKAEINFIPWEKGAIITGLSFIRDLSFKTIERILKERNVHSFEDLSDFISRCSITRIEFLLLSKCGALDWTGYNRKQLFFLADHLTAIQKKRVSSLMLIKRERLNIPTMSDFSLKQKVLFDLELLGFSPLANPLSVIAIKEDVIGSSAMGNYIGRYITMAGVKIFSRRIPSKKKEGFMKFISFLDRYGPFETFLPLKNYNRLVSLTHASSLFYAYGKVTQEFGAYTLHLEEIEPIFLR